MKTLRSLLFILSVLVVLAARVEAVTPRERENDRDRRSKTAAIEENQRREGKHPLSLHSVANAIGENRPASPLPILYTQALDTDPDRNSENIDLSPITHGRGDSRIAPTPAWQHIDLDVDI